MKYIDLGDPTMTWPEACRKPDVVAQVNQIARDAEAKIAEILPKGQPAFSLLSGFDEWSLFIKPGIDRIIRGYQEQLQPFLDYVVLYCRLNPCIFTDPKMRSIVRYINDQECRERSGPRDHHDLARINKSLSINKRTLSVDRRKP
jgi:hypothetical protein